MCDMSVTYNNTVLIKTLWVFTYLGNNITQSQPQLEPLTAIQQVTCPTLEHDENDHALYQLLIGTHYEVEQLVFVDESAFDRHASHHPYAWAPIGTHARRQDFFIHGKWCMASESSIFISSSA